MNAVRVRPRLQTSDRRPCRRLSTGIHFPHGYLIGVFYSGLSTG